MSIEEQHIVTFTERKPYRPKHLMALEKMV